MAAVPVVAESLQQALQCIDLTVHVSDDVQRSVL
jgi:hypothetical protein